MGIFITPQKEIDAYYESDRVNQSTLKDLPKGLQYFLDNQNKEYKEKPSFVIGSAVDTILTGEEGEFENKFYVSEIENKPSEVECSIIALVAQSVLEKNDVKDIATLDEYPGFIETAIEEIGWQPRWKMETKIDKIIEVGSAYFIDLIKSYGKGILSTAQNFTINQVVNSLRENETTKNYFDRDITLTQRHIFYQLPIYFTYSGVECKALLDMLIVELDDVGNFNKVTPVDLKTMSGYTLDFMTNVKSFRYDVQAAFYTEAVKHWLAELKQENVIINNFQFVVESTTNPGTPLVYIVSDSLLNIGTYGRTAYKSSTGIMVTKPILGFYDFIKYYMHYQDNEWKEDVRLENGKRLEIDWDGIITE